MNENLPAVKEQQIKKMVFTAEKQFIASNDEMNFIKEAGFAIQILSSNDYLAKCDPESIKHSVVNVALTGLTLNPALKYAYLIPRASKCILDISYIGMIKLLTDAGSVKYIDTEVIYENDNFDFRKGGEPFISHKPSLINRGNKIGAYAIAYFRDGGYQFIVLSRDDIEKVRLTSESWKNEKRRQYSPWETWEDEMWKKTAVKRLFKLLPKTQFSEKLIAAINNDHVNEVNDLPKEEKYTSLFDDEETEVEDVTDQKEIDFKKEK